MRLPLSLLLLTLAFLPAAEASWSMECGLSRPGGPALWTETALADREGQLKSEPGNGLSLEFDASLARGSFLFVLQDLKRNQRLAFTGSPLGLDPFGARLQSSSASLECRSRLSGAGLIPTRPEVELPAYLVCMLDEAVTEEGVVSQRREILSVNPAYAFGLQQRIREENERYSFAVDFLPYNPSGGLTVELFDKASGESAGYSGPGQTLVSSFILAFTQGDRRTNGKFLRLGCAYTHDPSLFQ